MNVRKVSPLLYGVGGLIAGLAIAFVPGAGEHTGGRFQMKTWTTPPGPSGFPEHGVYRLDTETGDVWQLPNNSDKFQKIN